VRKKKPGREVGGTEIKTKNQGAKKEIKVHTNRTLGGRAPGEGGLNLSGGRGKSSTSNKYNI
jgi:hypothetical protein